MALSASLPVKNIQNDPIGFQTAAAVNRALPKALSRPLAGVVSDIGWLFNRSGRQAVAFNLSIVLGRPVRGDDRLVRQVFRNFGRYLHDFLKEASPDGSCVDFEGADRLRKTVQRSGGAVLLSAHVANWELLGACVSRHLEGRLMNVVLPHANPQIDRMFADRRLAGGLRVITVGKQTMRTCLKALSEGGAVGLIGDHCFGAPGTAVPLFGQAIELPLGPALLSWRARVPLIPIFMHQDQSERFRVLMDEPIWPADRSLGFREASVRLMSGYAKALERIVRSAPEQWLLFRPMQLAPKTSPSASKALT